MSDASRESGWIAWMARNSVAANLLMLFLIVGGFLFVFQTKQEVFPEFDLDIVSISVPYLGATPEDVETGVLLAIEEEVRGLDGVKEITAVAREGGGSVSVELLRGTDPNKATQDIKNAVDRISSFPEQVERITVSLLTTRRKVIDLVLYAKLELGGSAFEQERVLRQLSEVVRDRLMQKDDITLVEVDGTRPLEISVEVPQASLRSYGLTLGDVADRIRRTARELPGGGVKTPSGEVLVRTDERRDYASEFRDIPIVTAEDGTQLRLADIATVLDTFADTDESTQYDGRPAALIQVYRVGDETPIQVSKVVREFAEQLRGELPAGIGVATQDDSSEIYADRIRLLLKNALFGLVLVFAVLGVFLNLKLAFWVMLGIPTSFLGAMLFLPGIDVSINMISLFAFIMALGMVVDDAIVVGENVYEMRQRGMPYMRAAIIGARQIAVPVTFSVLTNMVAFAPMLFVPGFSGKIFRVIPAVIIPVFFISLVESLLILPAHLGHSRPARGRGPLAAFGRLQQRVSNGLAWAIRAFYGPVVRSAIAHRYLTFAVGFAILIVVLGFIAGGRIDVVFFPNVAADFAIATVRLPFGAPVEETEAIIQRFVRSAEEVVRENQPPSGENMLRGIQSQVGQTREGGGPSRRQGSSGGHLGFVLVYFEPGKHDHFPTAEFVRLWRQRVGDVPGVESMTFKSDIGPGGGRAAINVKLSHRDVPTLERAAADLARELEQFPGVKDIDAGFSPGKRQRTYTRTPEAEALGIDSLTLGAQVRHAFYGAEALRQQRGRDEVKVMVRLPEDERRSEYDIEELVLRTPRGGEIMLAEASRVERKRSYTSITRVDGRRVLNVTADVEKEVANANQITAKLERSALPALIARYPGLSFSFEGERKDLAESMGALGVGFVLALIVIYAMLAVPLKSYIQPVIIMTAIPFGIVGAVLGHVLMGYDLSIMSMMGIVALAGVVVNDSLVMIHATNDRRAEGAGAYDAVASSGVRRFRPILLTSLTTFFGLAPMIFETSMQARFLIPMGISLGYGVLMATFITLLLVPALYMIIEDVRGILKTLFASGHEESPEARSASLAGGGD
jgi:multidrug efflux pump subunit AcrB